MSEKTLVKKLAKVMREIKHIEKSGYNEFHNYYYPTDTDVSESVRELLAKQDVILIPDVVEHDIRERTSGKGKVEYIATVKMKFTFIDGDSGESICFNGVGEGQDSGDKSVSKATTSAQKHALIKALMIPTRDDRENGNQSNNRQKGSYQHNGQSQYSGKRNNNQNQQTQRVVTIGMLKAKFISAGGDAKQFDTWYEEKSKEGQSNEQMEQIIDKKFQKKGA